MDKIHGTFMAVSRRAITNATRFEIAICTSDSSSGKVSTSTSGREYDREAVSLSAHIPNLYSGTALLSIGSGIMDVNFGFIPSPWATG